jgi:hypothetical protein
MSYICQQISKENHQYYWDIKVIATVYFRKINKNTIISGYVGLASFNFSWYALGQIKY